MWEEGAGCVCMFVVTLTSDDGLKSFFPPPTHSPSLPILLSLSLSLCFPPLPSATHSAAALPAQKLRTCLLNMFHTQAHAHSHYTHSRALTKSGDNERRWPHEAFTFHPLPFNNWNHSMHCNYKLLDSFGKSQVLQFKSFLLSHLYRASTNYYCLLSGFLQSNTILTYVCKQLSPYFFSTNLYANFFQWTFLPHCTLNNDWQYVGAQSRFPFLTLTVSLSLFLWLPLTPLNPADAHPPTVWPPIALAPTKTDNPTNANKPKSTKEERERESNANARKRRRNTSCRRAGCIELVALRHLAPDALVLLFVLPITFCMLPCAPTSPHTTTTTATLATTNKHCFSLLLLLFWLGFWSARCRLCRRRRQRQRDVDVFFCSSCHCCCCCFCCSYASCYTYPMRCYMLYMLNPSKLTTRNPQFEMCEPLYERVCRVFSCQRALKTIRQLIRRAYK